MDIQFVARQTKQLLVEARTEEAIELLESEAHSFYVSDLDKDADALKEKWEELRDHQIRGSMEIEDLTVEINKLDRAVLLFLHKLIDLEKELKLGRSGEATARLRAIVKDLEVSDLLVSEPQKYLSELEKVFEQIDHTYQIIQQSISDYLKPGFEADGPDIGPYLDFERGGLGQMIENGRGHCHIIQENYLKPDGIRDQLQQKATAQNIPSEILDPIDRGFSELGEADLDLFRSMVEIGDYLEGGASIIVDLLGEEGKDEARKKIRADRRQLKPLEDELKAGISELNGLKRKLGIQTGG